LPNAKISIVHGRDYNVKWKDKELIVVPMYHPAAGLRNPQIKEQTIKDFSRLSEKIAETNKIKTQQLYFI